MILQSLVDYYEIMAERGLIAKFGWSSVKVSFALELNADGKIVRVMPLSTVSPDGKKMIPQTHQLPAPVTRTVNPESNFLWDNSSYLLGFDGKKKPEHAKRCFEASRELHLSLLGESDDPFAKAICNHFNNWTTAAGAEDPIFSDCLTEILKGANLVFRFKGKYPDENELLCQIWQKYYEGDPAERTARDLVTGEKVVPQATHPSIKNVRGAQSTGAAIVSFNAEAFKSYGKDQDLNAPVGQYTAFAYTTALNALLADKKHVRRFGDTTVVFWAEDAEPVYQDVFSDFLDGGGERVTAEELRGCMHALAHGENLTVENIPLQPENRFFVLGLSPNAARLSVRFFLRNSFGNFIKNINQHYDDIAISGGNHSGSNAIPLWLLLRETINQKSSSKEASPQMAGDMLKSILSGHSYPATLYQQTQLRIRAEREISCGRAGIIKAYLTRLDHNEKFREALTVELNEQTNYQPYLLGRLFSVLEGVQQAANPGINTTIKDRYFTSACATPAVVFPTLLNLAEKHLRKLDGGKKVYWAKQVSGLTSRLTESYPRHQTLYDQGIFQLGYYHQTQKRYEKKDSKSAAETMKEENENV